MITLTPTRVNKELVRVRRGDQRRRTHRVRGGGTGDGAKTARSRASNPALDYPVSSRRRLHVKTNVSGRLYSFEISPSFADITKLRALHKYTSK